MFFLSGHANLKHHFPGDTGEHSHIYTLHFYFSKKQNMKKCKIELCGFYFKEDWAFGCCLVPLHSTPREGGALSFKCFVCSGDDLLPLSSLV
jgi:hypothetical protein